MHIRRLHCAAAFLTAAVLLGASPLLAARQLTAREAVHAAERFIIRNGYTDLPPVTDERRLTYESIELARERGDLLRARKNTLEQQAYAYRRSRKGGAPGWTVIFRYRHAPAGKTGRAVTMDRDGGGMQVEHVDALLRAFTPIRRGRERVDGGSR